MSGVAGAVMARPGRPKRSERDDVTAKIDRGVHKKAKMVASARGIDLAEYLTELLRGPVNRDFAREMKKIDAEGGSEE